MYLLCPKWAVLIIFTILALACNQSADNSEISTAIDNDSIFILIDQGKNRTIPLEERALLLQKAHTAASNSKNDTLKPKYFSQLSLAYLRLKDSLMFRTTNRQSIVFAKNVNDSVRHAEAHWDLGTFFKNNELRDSSYYNYREAHLLYDAIGDDFFSGRMLYNMAKSQVDVKDYTGAEVNAFKAIELLKPLEENRRLHNCYSLLGTISSELKEYNRALGYFENAQNYLNNVENKKIRNSLYVMLQNNIGNVFKEQKMFLRAIPYYQNALKADSLIIDSPKDYAKYLDNLATSRINAGDTLGVKDQLLEALQIRKEENDLAGMAKSYFSLAEYYMVQNDTVKALANAKLAEQFAIQSSNNKRLFETLGILVHLDKHTVRGIALTPTRGISRGDIVEDLRQSLSVPVGDALKGRVLNVFGQTIDRGKQLVGTRLRPLLAPPPTLNRRTTRPEMFLRSHHPPRGAAASRR